MKLTPIDELEDLANGVPVLAIEGTVKYAQELKRSKPDAPHAWTKQFFVLSSGTAEIACSMWDAEGNEVAKGEKIHIENTQNKKGAWTGMIKGSYMKDDEDGNPVLKHTLELRANQVKIKTLNGGDATCRDSQSNVPQSNAAPNVRAGGAADGVTEARRHIMQSANLYVLCVAAVESYIASHLPEIARTSEQFQATVASIWIETSSRRTTDGVNWWSYIDKMPTTPIKGKASTRQQAETDEPLPF